MPIGAKWWVVSSLAVGAAFVGGLTAAAQEGPAASNPGTGGETALTFEQEANLTPQEQIGWADEKYDTITQTREYASRLLATARQADRPDIVKINCLNRLLMEVDAQIQSYEDRRNSLREAINLGDNDRRMHEYRVLVVVYQKVQALRMEVETCIGEGGSYADGTHVTVERDPGMTPDDFTAVDIPDVVLDRPPHASGTY
jgi:hypothetical protein